MDRFVPPAFMGFAGQIDGLRLRDQYRTHDARCAPACLAGVPRRCAVLRQTRRLSHAAAVASIGRACSSPGAACHLPHQRPFQPTTARSVTLIARRSTHRAGTRQWRRGADLEAAVANFAESEQLVTIDGGAVQASFVQARWMGWRMQACPGLCSRQCAGPAAAADGSEPPAGRRCPRRCHRRLLSAQVRGSIPLLWSQTPNLKYKIPIRYVDESHTREQSTAFCQLVRGAPS